MSATPLKATALPPEINFIDLKAQQKQIRSQLDQAISRVLDHGQYVMGPEVFELEDRLAAFCGAKHAISCSNGTDALALVLMTKDIGPSDAVFVPSYTFAATAEVVVWFGATPIFIDSLSDTYNMDPLSLLKGIETAKKLGLTPKGIIPVDLFGQSADYDSLQSIADEHSLWIIADAAQSFGGNYKKRHVGSIGEVSTTSFFPSKSLSGYGDGGAIFTNNDDLADHIKCLRVHGQGTDKYHNIRIGMNGRMDTIQAAILLEKMNIFEGEILNRQNIANYYSENLKDIMSPPFVLPEVTSAWTLYTVVLPPHVNREALMTALRDKGIPTVIYYIKPLHFQTAYKAYPVAGQAGLPVCEKLIPHVLSLPMHPYLSREAQDYIIQAIRQELK